MRGFRFSMAPLLALAVFAASAGVVWLAHIEAGEMTTGRTPPLVKATSQPLKRTPDDPGGRDVADLGGVGDLLRDQPAEAEERLLPRSEQPLAPADRDSAGSPSQGSMDARAALDALVSEVRRDRPKDGAGGVGGPNLDAPSNLPPPSRPTGSADRAEPVTPRSTTPPESDTQPGGDGQPAEREIAAVSEIFEVDPGGRYRVQLAAVRAEDDAQRAWDVFQQQLGPFIKGLKPFFERAETSNGVFYRVQVGAFGKTTEADRLCVELKKQSVSCFVVSR